MLLLDSAPMLRQCRRKVSHTVAHLQSKCVASRAELVQTVDVSAARVGSMRCFFGHPSPWNTGAGASLVRTARSKCLLICPGHRGRARPATHLTMRVALSHHEHSWFRQLMCPRLICVALPFFGAVSTEALMR